MEGQYQDHESENEWPLHEANVLTVQLSDGPILIPFVQGLR